MKHVMVIFGFVLVLGAAPAISDEAEVLPTLEEIAALLPEPPQCLCAPYERYYDEETQAQLFAAKTAEEEGRYEDAFNIYLPLAESGNAEAQVRVSRYFFLWIDYYDATTYYRIEQPEVLPRINGDLLEGTFGDRRPRYNQTPEGARQAARWLEQAAAQGHVLAMSGLVSYYARSDSGLAIVGDEEQNLSVALFYVYQAARCNYVFRQHSLALRLIEGTWVQQDVLAAWKWYEISAQLGYERSREKLERLHIVRIGDALLEDGSRQTVREAGAFLAQEWLAANPGPVCELQ